MKSPPPTITDSQALGAFCGELSAEEFIAIDTEFIREKTYYSRLCLVQVAGGGKLAAIDPLAEGIDLSPLFALLKNPAVLKVFHAGRQDLEIFHNLMGELPTSVYDTQIAAMVCGYGDQVGYDRLVKGVLDVVIDKGQQFTDWSRRPLSERQLRYALDDVIHLAAAYPKLREQIAGAGRTDWVAEELEKLLDPALYDVKPMDAWRRIKQRVTKPAVLNRLRHLAAWREEQARTRDLPRNRFVKDETLLALADGNPGDKAGFERIRGFPGGADGKLVPQILKVLEQAAAVPEAEWPKVAKGPRVQPPQAAADLLRVLLKQCAEGAGVAPSLIASSGELDRIALGERDGIAALAGWRGEIFGKDAVDLSEGRIALSSDRGKVQLHRL